VIDHPESYREFTATCMITFAMLRGVREGWLDREICDPVIDRAWDAIKTRIGPAGQLVDVCAGTGKQTSLRAYYDRPAILAPDPRGGAMALLVCNEMAEYVEAETSDE
jgi:rhamnogalacturonyl hydrolase YesR